MYFVRTNLDVDVIVTELQVPSSSDEEAGVGPKRKRTIADANALFGFTIEREREREGGVFGQAGTGVLILLFNNLNLQGSARIDSIEYYLLRRPTFIHPQHSIDSSQDSTHPPYSKYYFYYFYSRSVG
jgi:hypothetical protein